MASKCCFLTFFHGAPGDGVVGTKQVRIKFNQHYRDMWDSGGCVLEDQGGSLCQGRGRGERSVDPNDIGGVFECKLCHKCNITTFLAERDNNPSNCRLITGVLDYCSPHFLF
jgi:hypothetical protein